MKTPVTLDAAIHTGNLEKEKTKHKDMMYLCDFNVYKII